MGDLASVRERGEENPNFALFFPFLGSFFGCEHGGFLLFGGKGQSLRDRERDFDGYFGWGMGRAFHCNQHAPTNGTFEKVII